MEKTGSKSLLFGFTNHNVAHWHSIEYFESIYQNNILSQNDLDLYDLAIFIGRKYNFKPLIIESIREPISQIISSVMQHLKKYTLNFCECVFCKNIDNIDELIKHIKEYISVDNWVNFKDKGFQSIKLWKKHFGIDLLKVFQKKNCYYDLPMAKILLIRLEDSNERERLFEKIGYEYEEKYSNKTEEHDKIGIIYNQVKDKIVFNEEELETIYSNEVNIFYTQNEINQFKKKWLKKIDTENI